jgi:hypothetical protein
MSSVKPEKISSTLGSYKLVLQNNKMFQGVFSNLLKPILGVHDAKCIKYLMWKKKIV